MHNPKIPNIQMVLLPTVLSFEQYVTLAISLQMISWSGNRVMSLTVLLFCSHRSKTVCSLPFFFGMQGIGTT